MQNEDLISRKALLEEYEWLMKQTSDHNKPVLQEHIDRINRQPAVDAVPVVRCRDCVVHGKCMTEQSFEFCGRHDGFCCVGKRGNTHE